MKETKIMINEFRGKYFFLSNFYSVPILYRGITYLNNEAAFQAQKLGSEEDKAQFSNLSPSEAKKLGRNVKLRPDWEEIKYERMYEICLAKFSQYPELKRQLLDTGDDSLEEGNIWGDKEWGTVNGNGNNYLGKILMKIRNELKEKS